VSHRVKRCDGLVERRTLNAQRLTLNMYAFLP